MNVRGSDTLYGTPASAGAPLDGGVADDAATLGAPFDAAVAVAAAVTLVVPRASPATYSWPVPHAAIARANGAASTLWYLSRFTSVHHFARSAPLINDALSHGVPGPRHESAPHEH